MWLLAESGRFESDRVRKGNAIEIFIIMFQDTWVKVYPFLMSRCFNLLWRGTLKVLPVNMPWRRRRGYRQLYPALTSALDWGWVVNATLRRFCTSGILRTRKRTCFCRNIMSVSRISWSSEKNPTSYTFSATCRSDWSSGDINKGKSVPLRARGVQRISGS